MPWPEIVTLTSILADSVPHYREKPGGVYERDTTKDYSLLERSSPLTLQETAPEAELRVMPLDGVSPQGLCLKLDHFGIHCFKSKTGNKSCDYLVLTEDMHKKHALFIELKTALCENPDKYGYLSLTNEEDRDKAVQLNSGTARFDYVCTVIEVLSGKKMFQDYEKHHFVLYNKIKNIKPTQNSIQTTRAVSYKYNRIKAIDVSQKSRITVGDLLTA